MQDQISQRLQINKHPCLHGHGFVRGQMGVLNLILPFCIAVPRTVRSIQLGASDEQGRLIDVQAEVLAHSPIRGRTIDCFLVQDAHFWRIKNRDESIKMECG